MLTLYLIRHAKSSWDHPDMADAERPLNNRGKSDAPRMGKRLKDRGIKPDLIISSPALRARATAELIAGVVGFPHKQIKYDWEVYEANSRDLLRVINKIEMRFHQVFLVGHNPDITYFTNYLCQSSIANIPTAGIVGIEFSGKWKEIKYGTGRQLFFDYPKNITE